jgi:hypothetical protein
MAGIMGKKKQKSNSKPEKIIKKTKKTVKKIQKFSSKECLKIKKTNELLESLETQSRTLAGKIAETRQLILENENALKEKILKKSELEDDLNTQLASKFSSEKTALKLLVNSAEKEESALKSKISCLQRITKIYDEKKAGILEAKKRQAFLKKQLEKLNKQSKEWG